MGSIVAAAFAMQVAGAPMAIAGGLLGLNAAMITGGASLVLAGAAIVALSKLMLKPEFMKILAKSALPQKTLTKGELGRQITAKTLRDLTYLTARDRQGDRDRMGPSATDIKNKRCTRY